MRVVGTLLEISQRFGTDAPVKGGAVYSSECALAPSPSHSPSNLD